LQAREGKSLGRLISDLLAQALSKWREAEPARSPFRWIAKPMDAKIDLADKHALLDALDAGVPSWSGMTFPLDRLHRVRSRTVRTHRSQINAG
jgi:hypothetical protein